MISRRSRLKAAPKEVTDHYYFLCSFLNSTAKRLNVGARGLLCGTETSVTASPLDFLSRMRKELTAEASIACRETGLELFFRVRQYRQIGFKSALQTFVNSITLLWYCDQSIEGCLRVTVSFMIKHRPKKKVT